MAETIDEITVNWTDEDGTLVVKELKKEILTRGGWTTIMFLYQELDKATGKFKAPKMRIGRYQKRNGYFIQQSKFVISSVGQAEKIKDVLDLWVQDMQQA